MILQPLPQEGIGFDREYAPASADERGHEQRMPTDIRTNVKCNASQRQDRPEYPSDLGLVGAKKSDMPVDLHPGLCQENEPIAH